jgi:molybdenum cofactor guanylyltransferase
MNLGAALLAGGLSSRMGRDKAFIEVSGIPLWRRQLEVLRALHPSEVFLVGPVRDEWLENDVEIVADAVPDSGPLGGLVAAFRHCRATHLLVLAVDLPNITTAFLRELASECATKNGVIPIRDDRFEPLAAVYPKLSLSLAENLLSARTLSLQTFARRAVNEGLLKTRAITDGEERLFTNLNTPTDLAAIERR